MNGWPSSRLYHTQSAYWSAKCYVSTKARWRMDPLNKRRLSPTVILWDKYRLPLPPARVFVTAAPQPTAHTRDGLEREENRRPLQVS
jgi:hypothetical protein